MYSLLIDTHDKLVSIVLFKDGVVLKENHQESKNKHSVVTMPLIDSTLKDFSLKPSELNEIVVVNGPGSFTGERIAVTIAKTMAYSLKIPIKTIDSLSLMAISVEGEEKIVAILDRNGAFVGTFNKENKIIDMFYLSKSQYEEFTVTNSSLKTDIPIDYNKVYTFLKTVPYSNVHEVKPLYVKGISALNDK